MRTLVVVVLAVVSAGCGEPDPEYSSGGGGTGGPANGRVSQTQSSLWGTSITPLSDGRTAVADPDGDSVFLMRGEAAVRLRFPAGSQPARVVEAGKDLAVVLRGTGRVARLAPGNGSMTVPEEATTAPCAEPRGVAFDAARNAVLVACAGGELATITSGGTTVVDTGLELRDVLVAGGSVWVTTFRAAGLLELDAGGRVVTHLTAPPLQLAMVTFTPRVAWRTVADGTRVVMVHQLHVNEEVSKLTNPGPGAPYYGKPYCSASVVSSALTMFDLAAKRTVWSSPIIGSLPVDVALSPGGAAVSFAGTGQVLEYAFAGLTPPASGPGGCLYPVTTGYSPTPTGVGYVDDEPIWFDRGGSVRRIGDSDRTPLVPERAEEPERTLFHAQSPSGVSCASCHPEGHEDGHTWQFGTKRVRSQSLEGGLLSTSPFHWDGRLSTVSAVLDETFVLRMGASKPDTSTVYALERWLDRLPARETPQNVDIDLAKRGSVLFTERGCNACHAGAPLTNSTTVDVGTGGRFQVPSLKGTRWRGPWMHTGCAQTLEQRFDPGCGGANHGTVEPGDVPALVAYLKTL